MTTTALADDGTELVAAAKPPTEDQRPYRFVRGIQNLYVNGETGKLAQLRRAAGNPFGADLRLAWFFDQLARSAAGVSEKQEETYFLVATLLAFDRRGLEARGESAVGNFGHTLKLMRDAQPGSAEAIERRFRILLEAEQHELPFRLRQLVKLTLSRSGIINWGRLLVDLLQWTRPSHKVQKEWARSYYTGDNTAQTSSVSDAMIDMTEKSPSTGTAPTE